MFIFKVVILFYNGLNSIHPWMELIGDFKRFRDTCEIRQIFHRHHHWCDNWQWFFKIISRFIIFWTFNRFFNTFNMFLIIINWFKFDVDNVTEILFINCNQRLCDNRFFILLKIKYWVYSKYLQNLCKILRLWNKQVQDNWSDNYIVRIGYILEGPLISRIKNSFKPHRV